MDESHCAGAGDPTWVLRKSSQCYYMLSHLSIPYSYYLNILPVCLYLPTHTHTLCVDMCLSLSFFFRDAILCSRVWLLVCACHNMYVVRWEWSEWSVIASTLFKESLACCCVLQARRLTSPWDSLVCTSHFSVGPLGFLICPTMSNFMRILGFWT